MNDIEKCSLCRLCAIKCPSKALRVDKSLKEWEITTLACITCGYCVEVCPRKCLSMNNAYSSSVTDRKESYTLMVQQGASVVTADDEEPAE